MATEIKILYLDRHTGQPLHPAWLRGYTEVAAYARLKDKRHRKLKKWLANGLKHEWVDDVLYVKCEWVDAYIMRNGQANRHPVTEKIIREGQ